MKYRLLIIITLFASSIFGQWNKSSNIFNSYLLDIECTNEGLIYTVGSDSSAALSNSNGIIYKSENFGDNWTTAHLHTDLSSSGRWMYKVQIIDANTIYTTNRSPTFFRTNNAGNSWDTSSYSSAGFATDAISFFNQNNGVIGTWAGEIFKTWNGGLTWTQVYEDGSSVFNPIFDISCPTDSICYASQSGTYNMIKSTDAGESWDILPSSISLGGFGTSIHAINKDTVVMVGGFPGIFRTTDGGMTWDGITSPINNPNLIFNDVHFVDSIGFAVGWNESIIKSTDYGETWAVEQYDSTSFEHINAVHMSENGFAIACSNSGSIYRLGNYNCTHKTENSSLQVSVSPNPFKEKISVCFEYPVTGTISITDLLGRNVKSISINNQSSYQIDLSELSSTLYLLNFSDSNGDKQITKRIVRTK